jgi:hypothetical protein
MCAVDGLIMWRPQDELAIVSSYAHPRNIKWNIERNTCLDEWLDLVPLGDGLLAHSFCDLSWVSFNTRYDGMRVGSFFCSIVQLLDYDHLPSGLSSLKNDSNLTAMSIQRRTQFWRLSDSIRFKRVQFEMRDNYLQIIAKRARM